MALKKNWQSGDTVYGTDLNAIATVADAAYKRPAGGIPESDLDSAVAAKLNASGAVSADAITDATTTGKAVIRAASAAAARSAIGAGTSDLVLGTSGSTACAGNDARLSDARTPSEHTHAGADIVSGTVAFARLPVGSSSSTVCAGDDARLSDERTPTAHAHDVADIDATGTASSTTYLRGDGVWATPPGGGGGGAVSADDITDATTTGKAVIRAASAAAARSAIGAGTSDLVLGTSGSTACAGNDARLSDARTPSEHTHAGADIVSGTVAFARLPVGSSSSTVCAGDDARLGLAASAVQPAALAAAQLVAVNSQTGTTYTLALADAGKAVECANASPVTVTVPPNSSVAAPVGTVLEVVQTGAGQVTLAPGSGVTLNAAVGLKTAGQWAVITLRKRATDTWIVAGDVTA